jgi:hypothetical protein
MFQVNLKIVKLILIAFSFGLSDLLKNLQRYLIMQQFHSFISYFLHLVRNEKVNPPLKKGVHIPYPYNLERRLPLHDMTELG